MLELAAAEILVLFWTFGEGMEQGWFFFLGIKWIKQIKVFVIVVFKLELFLTWINLSTIHTTIESYCHSVYQ